MIRNENRVKLLIAYASKTGTAAECAEMLKNMLHGLKVTVVDLAKEQPDPLTFDLAVIGSSIRFGKLRREAATYLQEQGERIRQIPHAFFLCCASGHSFEDDCDRLLSAPLREEAFAVLNFGGRLRLPRVGWLERFLLYEMRSQIRQSELESGEYTPTLPDILPENIGRMATLIRNAVQTIATVKTNE